MRLIRAILMWKKRGTPKLRRPEMGVKKLPLMRVKQLLLNTGKTGESFRKEATFRSLMSLEAKR